MTEIETNETDKRAWWSRLMANHARLLLWLRIFVALGLLALVIALVANDRDKLENLDWSFIPVAFACIVLSTVVKAYRWSLLVRQSHMGVSFRRLLGTYLVGAFFSTLLPTSVGGDAVRAVDTAAKTGRVADSTSSVLIERGIGLLAVAGAGSIFALFMDPGEVPIYFVALVHAMFIGGVFGLVVLRQGWFMGPITVVLNRLKLGKLVEKVRQMQEAFSGHLGSPLILFQMMVLSILANALTMGAAYVVLLAVTDDTPPQLVAFVPMIALSTAAELIPISIAALGVKESAYVYFLGLIDVDGGVAGAVAIIMRVLTLGLALLGGLVYLVRTLSSGAEDTPALRSEEAKHFIGMLDNLVEPKPAPEAVPEPVEEEVAL